MAPVANPAGLALRRYPRNMDASETRTLPLLTRLRLWWLAIRPKTLSIAAVPVLLGSALACSVTGTLHWGPVLAALLAAVLIQAATNLHNDAADFERGVDATDRLGPQRATAQGWFRASQVKRAAGLCFAGAFLLGIYLVWVGGWPILLLGVLSIAAGYAYTSGPFPLAHVGLGELFVWLFFGLGAVMGSFYLQTGTVTLAPFLAGNALGLLAAAVLTVNNYRDLDSDRRSGRRTLAVRLGRRLSKAQYGVLLALPFGLLWPLHRTLNGNDWTWLPVLLAPWAAGLWARFAREAPGPAFNRLLARTSALHGGFGMLLGLGALL